MEITCEDQEIFDLLTKTKAVLESKHPKITPALKSNIEAFYEAAVATIPKF